MKYALRMTAAQHAALRAHLFPGDGNEAVALLLCGRRAGTERHVLLVREVVTIPHAVCVRHPDRVTWPTDVIDGLLQRAHGKKSAIVKIHSHPTGYRSFSKADDESDRVVFSAIASLLDDHQPHASVVMLPDGELFGRILGDNGEEIDTIASLTAVGDDLQTWPPVRAGGDAGASFATRHEQVFGKGTTGRLKAFTAAIVGCSGTGSIVAEQLARLGVGRLVLIDPDLVEERNLNRILNTGKEDAYLGRPKVHAVASAIARMGLGQEVLPLQMNLINPEAVRRAAECDVVFGCMDGVEGRHLLNRLATFYTLPYFDVGVQLVADGTGGIDQIAGAVHYLQPGLSSLLSRGVYTMDRVNAEATRRTDPEMYERLVGEGYLRGVREDRPAVISVNMFFAALAVNEFLSRLHPYRNGPNAAYAYVGASLTEMRFHCEAEGAPCNVLAGHVGRGDLIPLLDRPALS